MPILMNRRTFLIGTGAALTLAAAPKLILPENTIVANVQGIILDCQAPVETRSWDITATDVARWRMEGRGQTEHYYSYKVSYIKVRFATEGKLIKTWCDRIELTWDKRQIVHEVSNDPCEIEIWDLPLAPYGNRIPNFMGLVRA